MGPQSSPPAVLSEFECLMLLSRERIGRVALTVNALPAVLAVNYRVVEGTVMFYTGLGRRILAGLDEAVVAFEADQLDPDADTGWTVVVVGTAHHVTESGWVEAARRAGLRPRGDSDHAQLVCVRPEIITGRQIEGESAWGEGLDQRQSAVQ